MGGGAVHRPSRRARILVGLFDGISILLRDDMPPAVLRLGEHRTIGRVRASRTRRERISNSITTRARHPAAQATLLEAEILGPTTTPLASYMTGDTSLHPAPQHHTSNISRCGRHVLGHSTSPVLHHVLRGCLIPSAMFCVCTHIAAATHTGCSRRSCPFTNTLEDLSLWLHHTLCFGFVHAHRHN
jgi:hypothetical protein